MLHFFQWKSLHTSYLYVSQYFICFQGELFDKFLHGSTLEECYSAVAAVANRWLDLLDVCETMIHMLSAFLSFCLGTALSSQLPPFFSFSSYVFLSFLSSQKSFYFHDQSRTNSGLNSDFVFIFSFSLSESRKRYCR